MSHALSDHSSAPRTRRLRLVASLGAGVLLAALLPVLTGERADAGTRDGRDLVRQRAELTQRQDGIPAASTPVHRVLDRASVDMEVIGYAAGDPTWYLGGSAVLRAAPPGSDDDAQVELLLGHIEDGHCSLTTRADSHETRGGSGTRYDWVGYSGPDGYFPTPRRPWDCAGVRVASLDGATTYDIVAGRLKNTWEGPQLKVGGVELLGQRQQRLRLVRGVRTHVTVTVRNQGEATARGVTLRGTGAGLKSGRARLASLGAGDTASLSLPVTLTGTRSTKLRLVVSAAGTKARSTLPVVRTAPPPRPAPGSYRSKDGRVRFSVAGGRITGWTGTMQQRCGGHGTPPTYTQVTLDFPRTPIPANGIVQARSKGSGYSTSLRLRIAGGTVTRGLFVYADTALCRASVPFTARRR